MLGNGRTLALLTPAGQGGLAVPSAARLARRVRRPARRRLGRLLLGRPAPHRRQRVAAAGPALPAGIDDGGDPMVGSDRDRLAARRRRPTRRWCGVLSGSVPVRLAFAPRPEFGQVPTQLEGGRRRAAGVRLQRTRSAWSRRASSGRSSTTAATTPRTPSSTSRRSGGTRRAGAAPRRQRSVLGRHRCGPVHAGVRERQDEAERPWREWCRRRCGCPPRARRPGAAQRADAAGAVLRADRRHHRRRHVVAARGDGRPAQLGLPLLLAARRRDERAGAGAARLGRRGRGAARPGPGGSSRARPATPSGCTRCTQWTVSSSAPRRSSRRCPGTRGRGPVRVGNAANRQVQLDVFGPIADLLAHFADLRGGLGRLAGQLMGDMVEAVSRRWHEPDHGIWEARIPPRHHVYSKVMGWLTVDRALRLGERHGMPVGPEWGALRDKIAEDVLTRGLARGGRRLHGRLRPPEIDASSLWIGLSGLLARRRPAVPGHRARGRGRAAQRADRLPLPLGRRASRARRAASTSAAPGSSRRTCAPAAGPTPRSCSSR